MINSSEINTAMFNLKGKNLEELSSFNLKGKKDDELMKAAQSFEAVFVNQLLEIIDSTVERDEGFFTGGRGEEMFRSMLNQETATDIASNAQTSFGLADKVYEQMKNR